MKFSIALSALVLAASAHAASVPRAFGQGQQFGGFGGFGGKQGQQAGAANKGGNNANKGGAAGNAASSTAAAATAAASSTAAAAAGGKGGNNAGAGAASANSTAGGADSGDAQTSLTLLQSVIAPGFAQTGQAATGAEAGQVASLTSTNNFINFCATTNQPITNGQQIKTGSCNPAPMGQIAAQTAMPASKFVNPPNGGNIAAANTAFTITMAIKNLEAGNFVNAQSNYYSAPQQLNAQGQIVGHSHFVVEQLQSLDQTTPLDNTKFAFFQGVNTPAQNGQLSVTVSDGLPAGSYRLASINAAANHQPVLVAVAQHGSLDDMVYFTVGGAGGNAGGAAASNSTAGAGAAASSAAAGNGKGGNNAGAGAAAGASAASESAAATATAAASKASSTAAAAGKGAQAGKNGQQGNRFKGFVKRGGLNRL